MTSPLRVVEHYHAGTGTSYWTLEDADGNLLADIDDY